MSSTEIEAKIEELKAQLKPLYAEALKSLIDEVLKHADQVEWTQSIPAFNDGDACVFRVEDVTIELNGEMEYEYNLRDRNTPAYGAVVALNHWLQSHYDYLEATYGSNSRITATRDNLKVTDYYDY